MAILARIFRGDTTRQTRFHTSNGHLCLNPVEFLKALISTIQRIVFKKYARLPWLVYSATARLGPLAKGKRVFEFGSGMSTLWFSERSKKVTSVEHNPEWYNIVSLCVRDADNVRVICAESKQDYLESILTCGDDGFDLVLIDGQYRKECVELVRQRLNPGAAVVVDNTDVDPQLAEAVEKTFADSRIRRFRGWVPGNLHPNETTIIQNIPVGIAEGSPGRDEKSFEFAPKTPRSLCL